MKVAQLLYSGLGGHGSVAFSLIAGDREHLWSNALCFIGVEPLLPAYQARCEQLGVPHRYVATRPGRPWLSWRSVFQWLGRERPDAILVHSATVLTPCVAYARMHRVPLIFVEHQSFALRRRRDWKLSAMAMKLADRVVMFSDSFAEGVRARLGKSFIEGNVAIIPNGVDTDLFRPAPNPDGGPFRIGMAARFTPTKRQDLLIDVLRGLQGRSLRTGWHLSFAGTGETLDEIREKAGPFENVSFEGNLDEVQLADWYRSLRVYALASDGEAFSTSILQAMASGLPIVASDVPGIRDQVTDEFGIIVANDDPDAWVKAITGIIEDRQLANGLGQAGRRICEERYSAVAMHRAYDQVISEAIRRA